LLEIQVDQKPARELQRIREVSLVQPFQSIPFDVSKRAITLFLTEVISKTIKEFEANPVLFQYLFTCIQLLDLNELDIANFHLVFLINYSKYLGFYPVDNYSEVNCLFDVANGKFNDKVFKQERIDKGISFLIHKLLNVNFHDMKTLQLDHYKRRVIMQVIIDYYNLHLGGIGEIKSLSVLQSLFE
jgi:DNA repair protein RecO (recombination protein O)